MDVCKHILILIVYFLFFTDGFLTCFWWWDKREREYYGSIVWKCVCMYENVNVFKCL